MVRHEESLGPSGSDRIDAYATHPFWGWLLLGTVMALMFLGIFTLAEYPMNFIDAQTLANADATKVAATLTQLAAQRAGWGQPLPAGVARGVALHESFGTVVAQVLEVEKAGERPRVRRVVCAVDCGVAVNPDGVAQQMESSVIFGLTAALYGRIDIVDGVVQQRNFHQVRMLRMDETPLIETHIVPSDRAPTGMGEPGTPPVAPALANAWFALTGQRLRRLPLFA